MIDKYYENQVKLLIRCLPAILKEECFAIKGGTAINVFCCDLPRLSVDIDLAYLPVEDRETTIENINKALGRIQNNLIKIGLKTHSTGKDILKLTCSDGVAQIKIEPNYTLRGYIYDPKIMEVCNKAQKLYGYAKARIISESELWGGKICAALDRQHPRDLFDIRYLLSNQGITPEIKDGFIALLLSGNRPLHEMLDPNFQMQETTLKTEFEGMTENIFTFEEAKAVFTRLVREIKLSLSENDKQLLLDFVQLRADLSVVSIPNLNNLPGIEWKVINLEKLRDKNLQKFNEQYEKLKTILM